MPTVIPNNDERAALNEPTNVTFDTNCIIALEENRPAAQDLRRIVHGATEQRLRLRVVAISASERQPGGECSESFRDFEARIAGVGLLCMLRSCYHHSSWTCRIWTTASWGVSSSGKRPSESTGFSSRAVPSSMKTIAGTSASILKHQALTANGVTVRLIHGLCGLTFTTEVAPLSHPTVTFIRKR